jgi:hypothetical protein
MNNLKTKITWHLNDYCKSECSYCPVQLRGGELPPETKDYLRVANSIIDSYRSMGRTLSWNFNGGEPLDMNDIVTLLKLCRTNGEHMELTTNGGKLWMDWWAIEPYVDKLNLTYHYWQNPALIKYIVDTFQKNQKQFHVTVPIRPDYFEEDMSRALEAESTLNINVGKAVLYKNADRAGGMFKYTNEQLMIMSGIKPKPPVPKPVIQPPPPPPPLLQEKIEFETKTWDQRYTEVYDRNPSYTGQMCNVGVEYLIISHQGWVSGSECNNQPLGNIWHDGWVPPASPQQCTMKACIYPNDQKITKFKS